MSSARTFFAILYAVVLVGWGSIWIAEWVHPGVMIALLGAILWGWRADLKGGHPLRTSWNRALLALGILLAIADWRRGSGSWFLAVVTLMLYVSAIRALSPKANRDLAQMVVLAFLELLAASVLTVSMAYGLFFLLFFLLAPWALVAITAKAELEGEYDLLRGRVAGEDRPTLPAGLAKIVTPALARPLFGAMAITVVVTVLLFALFPRLGTGMIVGRLGIPKPISGLSEEVRLGTLGSILADSAPAARIRFLGTPPSDPEGVYLRAVVLDTVSADLGSWRNTMRAEPLYSSEGRFELLPPRDLPLMRIEIFLEDLGVDMLPVVPWAARLRFPYRRIEVDPTGTIRWRRRPGPLRYRVASYADAYWVRNVPWSELRRPERLPPALASLVALPNPARLPEPIRRLTTATDLGWVPEVLRSFAGFAYTLELPEGPDPLGSFFARRAGHCELFATSLALMFRAAGVPAVIVNGFRGGEWFADEGYLLVRQRNAHSWVEVFHPQLGRWVPLDPTPPSPPPTTLWNELQESWQRLSDVAWFWWLDHVVSYDLHQQREAVRSVRRSFSGGFERTLRRWGRDLRRNVGRVLAAIGGLLLLLVLWYAWPRRIRRRRQNGGPGAPPRVPPRWIRTWLAALEPHLPPVPGPLGVRLREAVVTGRLERVQLEFWLRYERWRFGGRGDPRSLRRTARELTHRLRRLRPDASRGPAPAATQQ